LFSKTTLPVDPSTVATLGRTAHAVALAFAQAGYEVQTVRYATNLFPALARLTNRRAIVDQIVALEACCQAAGFAFTSLGLAGTDMQPVIPDILMATRSVFATSPIVGPDGCSIHGSAIQGAARVIQAASGIEAGFGNLRFAATANVSPGTPFFPAAHWDADTPALAIATESADLALAACREARDAGEAQATLGAAICRHGKRLDAVGRMACDEHALKYLGIDFSLAPYPDDAISIGGALEALTGEPLGAAGTLAAAATLTDAIQQADFRHTGFCGLMLPVLEDSVLARRAAEGRLRVSDLLQWSAVCGTGLDTVPLPGDASIKDLSAVLFDVAALSVRLHKPLTARLMPLPGKGAGDPVHFDFPYFADGGVLSIGDGEAVSPLLRTSQLALHPHSR
jgi:hypothetical protein